MAQQDLDLVLNPIRMRILQYLLAHQPATTQQIGEVLSDIPPASLYRHVAKLLEGDLIKVASETKIRGAVRRSYVVNTASKTLHHTSEQNSDLLTIYSMFMEIFKNFQTYLQGNDKDIRENGYFANTYLLNLTDDEYNSFLKELEHNQKTLQKYAGLEAKEGRKPRQFTTIASPVVNKEKKK